MKAARWRGAKDLVLDHVEEGAKDAEVEHEHEAEQRQPLLRLKGCLAAAPLAEAYGL